MGILRNVVIVIASVFVIGIGVNAFAHSERGNGGMGHYGAGMRCPYGSDYSGDTPQLGKEEYKQFEEKRESFLRETRDLRASLFEKKRELQGELAKSEMDAAKASRLQQEISDLQAQFDQKHINHMVEMKQLNPNIGRWGYMSGHHMMGGRSMMGPGMGPGMGAGMGWGGCQSW